MDLLGSILGNMDAPPVNVVDKKEQQQLKEAKLKAEKMKEAEKKMKLHYRTKMEKRISTFINDQTIKKLKINTVDKIQRSIVHDIAEVAGLASFSFGEDEVDRYVMLWKKEFAPSDNELDAYRNGEDYDDPEVAARYTAAAATSKEQQSETSTKADRVSSKRSCGDQSKYFDKYKKILGDDSGVDAAKATGVNVSYGMVPSENKKDQRSIEETLNEIRARKKQKLEDEKESEQ